MLSPAVSDIIHSFINHLQHATYQITHASNQRLFDILKRKTDTECVEPGYEIKRS